MIHDPVLTDQLSALPTIRFDGEVFRVTGISADPIAPSTNGGRWAPRPNGDPGVSVLYTSLERDGALAEVVSYLMDLTPRPSKPLRVHRLAVTTSSTLRLIQADLEGLGVDLTRYGERNYSVTQRIGAAMNFLGLDGLIASSARWKCENLMIFAENHSLSEKLEAIDSEDVDWQAWGRTHGFL